MASSDPLENPSKQLPDDQLWDSDQACEYLKVCPSFLSKNTAPKGAIPCVRLAKKAIRFNPADLQAYVKSHTVAGASA